MNRYSMSGHNGQSKTTADIAETIGESEKSTRRILKLNSLIPQLQSLVSSSKRSSDKNCNLKNIKDIGKTIGETSRNTRQILKLKTQNSTHSFLSYKHLCHQVN
ncbi:hypothetical protein J8TS2_28020 [Lederbergia ruris]|uniref:Uncharacterized protein n=1 Tax=Lederbergia ruris TaxID=217495 RepID=A0ABQ4KM61_9BACI|nr:hypothetical protein J8TS2_28020 [Lederbergia ruris]